MKQFFPDTKNISAIKEIKTSDDLKDLKRFLGMLTCLAKWVPDFIRKNTIEATNKNGDIKSRG